MKLAIIIGCVSVIAFGVCFTFLSFFVNRKSPYVLGEISIKDVPNEAPAFKRKYMATVKPGITITIKAKTWYVFSSERQYSGELNQGLGFDKWILFNPDNIADKILDHELVPKIQSLTDQIIITDKKWIASNPQLFTDESGRTWKLVR